MTCQERGRAWACFPDCGERDIVWGGRGRRAG